MELLRAYCLEAGHGDDIPEKISARPGDWTKGKVFPALAAAAQIIEEAREQMDKKTTPAGRLAALKRISSDNYNENFKGQFEQDGIYYICNGYQLLSSREPFPASVPMLKEVPFSRPAAELYPNISDYHEITLDAADIRAFKSDPAHKRAGRLGYYPYILHDGAQNIGMSPDKALDILVALPSDNFTIYARRPIDPIVFHIDGEPAAILMPVRVDQPKPGEEEAA